MKSTTVAIPVVLNLLAGAKAKGHDITQLLEGHGIAPKLLEQPLARVTFEQFASLSLSVMKLLDDEAYGLLPKVQPRQSYKHLCRSMIHAGSIGDALTLMAEFSSVVDNGLDYVVSKDGRHLRLSVLPSGRLSVVNSHAIEHVLITLHRTLCWMAGHRIPIRRVALAYAPPVYADEYRYFFYGAPTEFDQDQTFLEFDASIITLPNIRDFDQLQPFLRRSPLTLISQTVINNTITEQVRSWLQQQLQTFNTAPTVDQAAAHFERHSQSLRRALRKEGLTYEQIKLEIRRDLAIAKLNNTSDSIESISSQLGFSEPSAFIRAFRDWAGMTPKTYRSLGKRGQ